VGDVPKEFDVLPLMLEDAGITSELQVRPGPASSMPPAGSGIRSGTLQRLKRRPGQGYFRQ